ncbi:MAG: DUF47 family protein [Ruaniaceae bacterium]|nr:DUF47 family protein [Ruaniaceae bacterium]
MKLSLTPKDSIYFTLLTESAAHLVRGSNLLAQLVTADRLVRPERARELHDVEHLADEAAHAIVRKVNASFVTPLDRDDLLSLASLIDDCMDYMDEAGDLIVLYKIDELAPEIIQLVEILQRCAELTVQAVPHLQTMSSLQDFWVEINRLENQADKIYRSAIADLFDREDDAKALIKQKDVILTLEAAVDAFETLANTIEAITVKES